MKILNTNIFTANFKNRISAPSFKGKDELHRNKDDNPRQYELDTRKNPEIKYPKMARHIFYTSPLVEITLKDRKDALYISSLTVARYLTTNGKTPNKALLDKFAEVYTKNLQTRMDSEDEACKLYVQTIQENSKLRNKPNSNTKKLNSSSATAALLLSSTTERVQIAKKQAYEETELFFEIAKTNKGYDFSRQKEKRLIASFLHMVEQNTYRSEHILPELKSVAKDEHGKLDVDFAKLICSFLEGQDFPISPLYIAEKIKYFTEKDPKNAAKIIEAMLEVNKSSYQLDDCDPAFENLMKACFTEEGNFIQDAPEVILKLISYADNLLDCWLEADAIDESDILYYLDLSKTVILGYMGNIIDEDGSINESEIPDEKDFHNAIEELFDN